MQFHLKPPSFQGWELKISNSACSGLPELSICYLQSPAALCRPQRIQGDVPAWLVPGSTCSTGQLFRPSSFSGLVQTIRAIKGNLMK